MPSTSTNPELAHPAYQQLRKGWIRVMSLHPGTPEDKIEISLGPERLGDPGNSPYHALSYAWGDRTLTHKIDCEGSEIEITANLNKLLHDIRSPTKTQRFWIDAICINQTDIPELNHQVSQMRWIYSQAEKVFIWIGRPDRQTQEAIAWIQRWQPEQVTNKTDYWQYWELMKNFEVVTSLLERAWFHRAWTFQEACLAADAEVLCGRLNFPWTYITNAALALEQRSLAQKVLGSAGDSILALARFASTTIDSEKKTADLLTLLRLTRGLQSSDPRDKVFAILGMLTEETNPGVEPDYSPSITAAEVYTQCARLIIAHSSDISILSSCLGPAENPDLPSWVPDWRLPRRTAILRSFEWPSAASPFYQINQNRASPLPAIALGPDPRKLPLHGLRLATVTTTHRTDDFIPAVESAVRIGRLDGWNVFAPRFRALFRTLGFAADAAYPRTGESAMMAVFRTVCADRLPAPAELRAFVTRTIARLPSGASGAGESREIIGPPIPARWVEGAPKLGGGGEEEVAGGGLMTREEREMQAFLYICDMALNILDYPLWATGGGSGLAQIPRRILPFWGNYETHSIMDKIGSTILTFTSGRVLFRTDKGLIGIGPECMREGDQVWDLFGGHVPYLLRPNTSGGDAEYLLVGECYVHGVMKGELWQAPRASRGSEALKGEDMKVESITLV